MFLLSPWFSGSDVTYATFFSTRTTHMLHHAATLTQTTRREMCVFLAGNTVIILSLCQLKMRILRFVVHSALATKYYRASKAQRRIWRNIWSRSTVQVTEQVERASRKLRAKPRPWLLQEVPHRPNNKSWTCKTSKWGRVEEVGRAVCCRRNAAPNPDWLALV